MSMRVFRRWKGFREESDDVERCAWTCPQCGDEFEVAVPKSATELILCKNCAPQDSSQSQGLLRWVWIAVGGVSPIVLLGIACLFNNDLRIYITNIINRTIAGPPTGILDETNTNEALLRKGEFDKTTARNMVQFQVKSNLWSPLSAKFPQEMQFTKGTDGHYVTSSYVHSVTELGKTARTQFVATVDHNGNCIQLIFTDIMENH